MSLKGRQLQFIVFYLEKLDIESKINGGKSLAPLFHSLPQSPDTLSITDCHVTRRTRPYHRPSCFYEKVKMEHKQVMSDLQRLKNDNRDASEMFRELTEEKGFY
ncbi:hypothetical protein STEG23_029612 [Scotinomys teguina]